jgi:hypothetical protein
VAGEFFSDSIILSAHCLVCAKFTISSNLVPVKFQTLAAQAISQ